MDLAGTAVNAIVVSAIGLVLAWFGKGRFEAIEGRLDRLERRVDELRTELSARIDALSGRIDVHIERHAR